MGPANMKRYQLFLWESTERLPQKIPGPALKNNTVIVIAKLECSNSVIIGGNIDILYLIDERPKSFSVAS